MSVTGKLVVLAYEAGGSYPTNNIFSCLSDDDHMILVSYVDGEPKEAYFVAKTHAAFRTKKLNTFINAVKADDATELTEAKYTLVKNKPVLLIYEDSLKTSELRSVDLLESVISVADALNLDEEDGEVHEALNPYVEFVENCKEGGVVRARINTDGVVGGEQDLNILSLSAVDETVYDPKDGMNPSGVTAEAFASYIKILSTAVRYEGFSPKEVARALFGKLDNDHALAVSIIALLIVYVAAGNNASKLNKKREDLTISRKVLAAVETLGVERRPSNKSTVTLSRLAIIFPGLLLLVRKMLKLEDKLTTQYGGDLASEYQDLAFAGIGAVASRSGYSTFYQDMSAAIWKEKKDDTKVGVTEDEKDKWTKFKSDCTRWQKIATQGFESSKVAKSRMAVALATEMKEGEDYHSVLLEFAKASIQEYKADM